MADNTTIQSQAGGDLVRDIDRSLNTGNSPVVLAKTQVVQLDAGGQANESLVSAQNPMPTSDPSSRVNILYNAQQLLIQRDGFGGAGFVPFETPNIGA
jgi:hypothetical protein